MKRQHPVHVLFVVALTLLVIGSGGLPAAAAPSLEPTAPQPAGTWRSAGPLDGDGNPVHTNAIAASPLYAQDGALFAAGGGSSGRYGALYRSTDRGYSWTEVLYPTPPDPFSGGWFGQVAVAVGASGQADVVFASYNGNLSPTAQAAAPLAPYGDLYRSTDGGESWSIVLSRQQVGPFALSPNFASDQTLFAIANGQLERSTDAGATWQALPFPAPDYDLAVYHLALSPDFANDHTLYAGGLGAIHRSTDGGVTWEPLPGLMPTYGLALPPNFASSGVLWSTYRTSEGIGDGTPESGVLRHSDRGDSWQLASAGLPGAFDPNPRHLAVSPRFEVDSSLFTALSGPTAGSPHHSLFHSLDGGANWLDLGPAPADPDVLGLAASYTAQEGLVAHLATEQGVWHYGAPRAIPTHIYLPMVLLEAALPPDCEEGIANGGFETNAAWSIRDNPVLASYVTLPVHEGARAMRTGIAPSGANVESYSPIEQTITLPSDLTSAELRFWRHRTWGDAGQAAAGLKGRGLGDLPRTEAELVDASFAADYFYVLAIRGDGSLRWFLVERVHDPAWNEAALDLSSLAGETVRLQFGTYNNGAGGRSATYLDDVSLRVCTVAAWSRNE